MGSVPEARRIFGNMTVRENLLMGAYHRSDKPEIAEDYERMLGLFPRLKERLKQRGQSERLERASFNSQRSDDGLEVRRSTKREAGMIGEEPRPLGRRALSTGDGRRVGHRLELSQPFLPGRRDGKAGHDRDDAIEFKGPEGACVHGLNQAAGRAERRPFSVTNQRKPRRTDVSRRSA